MIWIQLFLLSERGEQSLLTCPLTCAVHASPHTNMSTHTEGFFLLFFVCFLTARQVFYHWIISQPLGYTSDCHSWVMFLIAEISSAAQYLTKPRIGNIHNKAMTVALWWRKKKNNLNETVQQKILHAEWFLYIILVRRQNQMSVAWVYRWENNNQVKGTWGNILDR